MTNSELDDMYFDWLFRTVCGDRLGRYHTYQKLLRCIHSIPFTFSIDRDGNRAEDGLSLRYRFKYENAIDERRTIEAYCGRDCSVLEMMVALALRCEEQIMNDPEIGNRIDIWFWDMITSLGLDGMTMRRFDESYVREKIQIFLDRAYDYDGTGGLFTIPDTDRPMWSLEIWYQMTRYLSSTMM